MEKIEKYAKHNLPFLRDNFFEHGFYYGEQCTKTYVTTALDKTCEGFFMQEYPIERKKEINPSKLPSDSGKIDYWCRYGAKEKISLIIEVKQHGLRFYSDKKYTIYKEAKKRHKIAVKQIKDIKNKSDYAVDNLYCLALTLMPFFTRYDKENDVKVEISDGILSTIAEDVLSDFDAHACGYVSIPHEFCPIDGFKNRSGQLIYENHPAFMFAWSIFKVTKN